MVNAARDAPPQAGEPREAVAASRIRCAAVEFRG
jgi:hypothetical protein